MKKTFFQWMLVVGVLVSSIGAQAQTSGLHPVLLAQLVSDYTTGESYLGYLANPDHSIHSLFVENSKNVKTYFTMDELKNPLVWPTLMSGELFGKNTDLISFHAESADEQGDYSVTMKYVTSLVSSILSPFCEKQKYSLVYNKTSGEYELKDKDALHSVHNIIVATKYLRFRGQDVPVGIQSIISSQ